MDTGDALSAAREAVLGLGRSRGGRAREGKTYETAEGGSRAEGRGTAHVGRHPRRWIAGDFKAGFFRRRRDALRHCPPGTQPMLVEAAPEGERTRFAGYNPPEPGCDG